MPLYPAFWKLLWCQKIPMPVSLDTKSVRRHQARPALKQSSLPIFHYSTQFFFRALTEQRGSIQWAQPSRVVSNIWLVVGLWHGPFQARGNSITQGDLLLLIDGLPARSGPNVGQTAEGYVSYRQDAVVIQRIRICDLPGINTWMPHF